MKVAALGIPCEGPHAMWAALSALPPVDLLVLPELCFMPWLCASDEVLPERWEHAVAQQYLERLSQLPATVVAGTVGTTDGTGRYNDGFVFSASEGLRVVHRKTFLPDEPGFWEASWYDRGPVDFTPVDTPVGRLGMSICTEMWFTQHTYPDVDVIVVPRATPAETTDKWLAGGAALAVCNGAFCVSSNRAEQVDGTTMGGNGWIIDPDGSRIGHADSGSGVLVAEIDLSTARAAKHTYPRYVSIGPPDAD